MKVCMLASSFPRSKNDNSAIFIYELALWLIRKGITVVVIAPHDKGCKFVEEINGIKIYRFPYFFPFKYQQLAYGSGILKNLQKNRFVIFQIPLFIISQIIFSLIVVIKENIDIVHAHWSIPQGGVGIILNKIIGTPCITSIHGSDVFGLNNHFFRKLNSMILKNADILTANSSATFNKAIEIAGRKPDGIIPMGVNLNVFGKKKGGVLKQNLGIEGRVILSVGRLNDWKGTKFLIAALSNVIEIYPHTTLLIAGDGPEKKSLVKLSEKLKIKKHVVFLGQVQNHDLVDYYNASDVFVIPSIVNKKGETEGLGVVVLEALACKVPVIGSGVGGIPDIIKDNITGLLVKSESSDQIAEKIITIFSDEELKKELVKNGYNFVKKNFSWGSVSNEFMKNYKKMITNN